MEDSEKFETLVKFEGCVDEYEFSLDNETFGATLVVLESKDESYEEDEEAWAEILMSTVPEEDRKHLAGGVFFILELGYHCDEKGNKEEGSKVTFPQVTAEDIQRFNAAKPLIIENIKKHSYLFGFDPDEMEKRARQWLNMEETE